MSERVVRVGRYVRGNGRLVKAHQRRAARTANVPASLARVYEREAELIAERERLEAESAQQTQREFARLGVDPETVRRSQADPDLFRKVAARARQGQDPVRGLVPTNSPQAEILRGLASVTVRLQHVQAVCNQLAWRKRNPAKYRAYQRELMRTRRAVAKREAAS